MASQLMFVFLYLTPVLPGSLAFKTALVIGCILMGYFLNYSISSIFLQWANAYVDPAKRGEYSASKEMMSLLGGMIFTFAVGIVMDRFELSGRLAHAFLLLGAIGLAVSVCGFFSLLRIGGRVVPTKAPSTTRPLGGVLHTIWHNRSYRSVVFWAVLWNVALYLTVGFLGTFKIKELQMSMGMVQIINILGNTCRYFLSKPFGRYADRTSYAKGIELAMFLAAAAFAVNAFATPSSRVCIVVFTVLYFVSCAGTGQNMLNIMYNYVPAEHFVQASAIKNSIGGVCGFLASLLGGKILSSVQQNGNTFLGIPVYGQQVLSAISCLLILAAALYTRLVVEKQKVIRQ